MTSLSESGFIRTPMPVCDPSRHSASLNGIHVHSLGGASITGPSNGPAAGHMAPAPPEPPPPTPALPLDGSPPPAPAPPAPEAPLAPVMGPGIEPESTSAP